VKLEKFKIVFIIIPYHHIGGAERVHLNIIKSLKRKPIVFFDYSNTEQISKEFSENAYCFLLTDNKRKEFAFRFLQIISFFLPIVVFGCNSSFFLKIISKLKKRARLIDLTHAFSYPEKGMEIISLPYVDFINTRIVINNKTFEDYKNLYDLNNIDVSLLKRFRIIENGIKISDFDQFKIDSRFRNFTIGFVGRNSPEKRPELFFKILESLDLRAKVIGDNFDNFKNDFPEVIYFENCNKPESIREQFSEISLLVITSSREGFPLVIMEAMELGIPVLSTNVGSIADHLINDRNGYCVDSQNDNEFLDFIIDKIKDIVKDRELYQKISLNARQYACENFDIKIFEKKYQKLFYE